MKKQLKRLLAVALALVLTMSLVLPAAAVEGTSAIAEVRGVGYTSLADAFTEANGDTVTLLANIELTETITVAANESVILDLNDKVLSGVSSDAKASAVIINNGTLVIQDSGDSGKITSQALSPDKGWGGEGESAYPTYANNTINNYGTLTLLSGTIENATNYSGATYAIDNYSSGSISVQGGKVVHNKGVAIRQFANSTTGVNSVAISGGTVEGKSRAVWLQLPGSDATVAPKAALNINGGTLISNDTEYNHAVYVYSFGNSAANTTLNVTAGIINGDIATYCKGLQLNNLAVTGGTFNGAFGVYGYDTLPGAFISGGSFKGIYDDTLIVADYVSDIKVGDYYVVHKHNSDKELPAESATCTEDGLTAGKACSVCDKTMVAQEIAPATDHDWVYQAGYNAERKHKHWMYCQNFCGADIKEMGDHVYTHTDDLSKYRVMEETECGTIVYVLPECEVCGFDGPLAAAQKKVYKEGAAHKFDEGVVTKEATCSHVGEIVYTCTYELCGFKETEEIPVIEHAWSTDFQPSADTHWNYCTNEGCTAKKNEAAHTWGKHHMDEAHIVADANNNACAVAYHISCDVCAKSHATDIFWVKQENPVHKYDEGKITTAPTCTAAGVKTYTCQNAGCGHTKTETVPVIAHTEVEIPAVAATCTEPGLTAGKKCSVCGEVLTAQTTVPATGHDWGYRAGVTAEGHKHWMWCRNFCGADIKEMGDHVYTHSDDLSKYRVMEETECGTIVYRLPECEVCGFDGPLAAAQKKVYKEDGEHVFDEGEVIKESTCSEAGEILYTCTVEMCGYEKTEKLPLAAHSLKKVEGKEATYSAAGVKEHYACSACSALFADAEGKTAITDIVIPQLIKVEGTTAKVETGAVDTAITDAVEKAEQSGEKAEVVIEVEKAVDTEASTDPSAPADTVKPEDVAKVVEVQLPVASIDKVVEAKADLTVVMPNVTVTMDTAALEAVSDQAAGEAVTLVVEEVKTESLTVAQQKTVEKYDVAVTITAELICQTTGEKIWTEKANEAVESGSITVKLPFTPAENTKGSDYVVLFIDDDGSVTEITTEFVDGHLVFALEHFSDYVVVNTAAKAYPDSPATGDNANIVLLAIVAILSVTGLAVCVILARKNRYIPKH